MIFEEFNFQNYFSFKKRIDYEYRSEEIKKWNVDNS
jgi:hypothetical protein